MKQINIEGIRASLSTEAGEIMYLIVLIFKISLYRFHSNVFLLRGFPLLKLHVGGLKIYTFSHTNGIAMDLLYYIYIGKGKYHVS